MTILTAKMANELRSLGDDRDKVEWRIGEIAREAWKRNINELGGKFYRFQVFAAIAREARCSKGRVEKLFGMIQFFPDQVRQKYPSYKLGHFEEAMNFGPEQAGEVLEYISVYAEDRGELPKVKDVDFLYRREILGQPSTRDMTPQGDPTNVLQYKLIDLMKSIRGLLTKKPLSDSSREKLDKGLSLIEEVLPELVDEEKIINYN